MTHARMVLALSFGVLLVFAGCSGSDGSNSRGPLPPLLGSDIRLASADVLIDGQSVRDATIPPGSGTSTLFSVTLADPADASRIRAMYLDYPAHSTMGMMGEQERVQCYDDGTHGDPIPGDGTFCYLDVGDHIGPHDDDCPRGEYLYRFHGTDITGHDTNSLDCRVTVQ